jgi:cephalosporin hydroxylase
MSDDFKNLANAFRAEVESNITRLSGATELQQLSQQWLRETLPFRYSYNFSCLGRPIVQYPQDIIAIQELIWDVRPDLIIETGVAHGGSLVLSASMLALLDYCDASSSMTTLHPHSSHRRVIGVDIEIRPHNRSAIEAHPLAHKIDLIQGSSISVETIAKITRHAQNYQRVMVLLDSNHTEAHVFAELVAYAPMVTVGSYCVVFDTVIEQLPEECSSNRPWSPGNNPMTALKRFLSIVQEQNVTAADGRRLYFKSDFRIDSKLLVSVAPCGYLERIEHPD